MLLFSEIFLTAASLLVPTLKCAHAAGTQWTTYLRTGPGWQFAVEDEISSDHPLDVESCAKGWCRVHSGRAEGYMRQNLLTDKEAQPVPPGTTHDCFDTVLSGYQGASHARFCGK